MHHIKHSFFFAFLFALSSVTITILATPIGLIHLSSLVQRSTQSEPDGSDPPQGYVPNSEIEDLASLLSSSDVCEDIPDDGVVPDACKLVHPSKDLIVLRKVSDGPTEQGHLGKEIGVGNYGKVFLIEGIWSTEGLFKTRVTSVAKWFTYRLPGLAELQNLFAVGELGDFGVHVDTVPPSLWATIPFKNGEMVHTLPSFVEVHLNKKKCKKYMSSVRKAIVTASAPYLKRMGAPSHADLHQGNVLVEEIEKDGKLELIAWLVDWGWIKWRLVQWRIATAEELQKFEEDILEDLNQGYDYPDGLNKPRYFDFSDENNC